MKTKIALNPLTGQFDLVTSEVTPSEVVGGDPLTVAGYDAAGVLDKVPGLTFDAAGQISSQLVLPGPTSPTSLSINPIIDDPLTGQYQGIIVSPDINDDINGLRGVTSQPVLSAETTYSSGFQDNPQFETGSVVTGSHVSAELSPNFQAGSAVRSFTGINVNPQFSEDITDDIRGAGVFFNSPTVGTNINGMEVAINNASAPTGSIKGINISINNSTDSQPQGPVGLESNARVSINSETQLQSGLGFQIGNRVAHQLNVAPGSPVTGTDSLANNLAGNLSAQDDVALGGFGLGFASVGFIASVGVAATKTVDAVTAFLPAISLPDPGYTTGGDITDMNMVRVVPPLPQGGTANITNLYGFKIDSGFGNFGTAATNAWGLYLDSTANNYLGQGQTQLGGSTSGRLAIEAAPVTTSHTLVMPAAQGAASTVLTNDGAGNLSWAASGGGPSFTTTTLVDGQSTLANVTGFLVDPTVNKSFTADATVKRYATNAAVNEEDTAFYSNVGTAINTGGSDQVTDIIQVQGGGSVAVGSWASFNGNSTQGIVKLNSAGVPDATFATNAGTGLNALSYSVAEQADAKLVVGGFFTSFNGNSRLSLVRLNADGTEDTAFYTNLGTSFNGAVNSVFVQADGKILVGGDFTQLNGNTRNRLVRLNSDGTEDTAFYTNLGTAFDASIRQVIQTSNTDVVAIGNFLNFNGNSRQFIVRLAASGVESGTFNGNYDTAGGADSTIVSIAEQSDNKLIMSGDFLNYNGAPQGRILRLNADGTPDTVFNTANVTGFGGPVGAQRIRLQGTGTLVMIGGFTSYNGTLVNRLLKMSLSGAIDPSFDVSIGTGLNQFSSGLFVQSNNQLLIGGQFTQFNGLTRNGIMRFGDLQTVDLINTSTIKGVYKDSTSTWVIGSSDPLGDLTGVSFRMTALGQLQYTSTLIGGTLVDSYIKFQVTGI